MGKVGTIFSLISVGNREKIDPNILLSALLSFGSQVCRWEIDDPFPATHEYHIAPCGGDSATDGKLPRVACADLDDLEYLLASDSHGGRAGGGGTGGYYKEQLSINIDFKLTRT